MEEPDLDNDVVQFGAQAAVILPVHHSLNLRPRQRPRIRGKESHQKRHLGLQGPPSCGMGGGANVTERE